MVFTREIEPAMGRRGLLAALVRQFAYQHVPEPFEKPSGGIPFAAVHRKARKAERQNRLRGRRQQRG